jgi:signal transduction histidine kinase
MGENEKFRVLIVDDNADNLMVVASALSTRGFAIMLARSGFEAIDCVDKFLPDLILLDVVMPELDGYATCIKLKALPCCKNVPVIFLTARNDKEDVLKGFEAGGADFVCKPFNRDELCHRVETHARLYRLQLQLQLRNEALEAEISLRARRERQLSLSEKARLAGRIAAGISHHFNNMFHSLLGFCELIQAAVKPESEVFGYVQKIVDATKKTRQIVDQLASYPCNLPSEASCEIRLSEVLSEVELAFSGILPQNVSLICSKENSCPDGLLNKCDVMQALTNVIMNSIEAMPEGGGQIVLRAAPASGNDYVSIIDKIDSEANFIELSVSDNGIGMESQTLEKAFEPFFTASKTSVDKNGLGLSVVQGVMKAVGGHVYVDSEPGNGTVVRLLFPLKI